MPADTHQSRFGPDGLERDEQWPDIDGAEVLRREPTDAEQRWGITWEELNARKLADPTPTGERERRCRECGKQVTETTSGIEVGHAKERDDGTRCPLRDGVMAVDSLDDFIGGAE